MKRGLRGQQWLSNSSGFKLTIIQLFCHWHGKVGAPAVGCGKRLFYGCPGEPSRPMVMEIHATIFTEF